MSKVVLITGTSSGVGLRSVIQFAQHGYITYATMRNLDKAGKLKEEIAAANVGDKVKFLTLDVCNQESVTTAVQQLIDAEKRIDVLVNNAGFSMFGGVESTSMEKMKEQFDTNFFGAVMMMKAVLPTMRSQKSGRIINVSSVGGVWGQPFSDIYCASKFALEGFTESMSSVYAQFGIYCSLIEPGAIATEFITNAQRPEGFPQELLPLVGQVMSYYRSGDTEARKIQTADEVAAIILQTAENPKPNLRVQTNPSIDNVFRQQLADPTGNAGVDLSLNRFFNKSNV